MDYKERVWGYTGAIGLVQALATGYFTWDLYMCTRYVNIFGVGMLAHGLSALCVYSFGYVSAFRGELVRVVGLTMKTSDHLSTITGPCSSCTRYRHRFSISTGTLTSSG